MYISHNEQNISPIINININYDKGSTNLWGNHVPIQSIRQIGRIHFLIISLALTEGRRSQPPAQDISFCSDVAKILYCGGENKCHLKNKTNKLKGTIIIYDLIKF